VKEMVVWWFVAFAQKVNGCFNEKLPEKRYKIFSLAHSSLTAAT
jgi:hypothetical protein